MRQSLLFVALAFGLALAPTQADASIQSDIVCIEPDIEFPVPCDDDD